MIILLNGTSSAGKTTLAKAVQEASDAVIIHFGIDHFFFSVHPRFVGMGDQAHLGYQFVPQADGRVTVNVGPKGREMSRAMRRSVKAMVDEGLSVIVDDLLFSAADYEDYVELFEDFLCVAVKPPLEVAEKRETERKDRPIGVAKGLYETVYDHAPHHILIDTAKLSPAEGAQLILERFSLNTAV